MIHQQNHQKNIQKDIKDHASSPKLSNNSSISNSMINSTPSLPPHITNDPSDSNNQTIFQQFQQYSVKHPQNTQTQQQPSQTPTQTQLQQPQPPHLMHLPLHQQNVLNSRLQPGISQPSDPALQRLGLSRRVSTHMQRLPPLSNIHNGSSPASSPNGALLNNDYQNLQSYQLQQNTPQLSPSDKPLFKNVWGFNEFVDQASPTNSSFYIKSNYQSPISSNYQQQRMNSISGVPNSTLNVSPLRSNVNMTPSNLSMSQLSHHNNINVNDSEQIASFNNVRSNSFAVPNSKFNNFGDNTSNNADLLKQRQINQIQQQKQQKQLHNQHLQLLQLQQQQLPQRRYSQQYEPRLSNINMQPNMSSNSSLSNSNMNLSIESQQQQIIPPLRALGPVQSFNDMASLNSNNAPRRESVAAVYHNQRLYDDDLYNNELRNNRDRQTSETSMMSIDDLNEIYNQHYGTPNMIPNNNNNNNNNSNNYDYNNVSFSNDSINLQNDMRADSLVNKIQTPRFEKINSVDDLSPIIHEVPKFRRVIENENKTKQYVSPLKALTSELNSTYSICVPEYDYQSSKNPRRVLTKNNKPFHNNGYDNESYDYILYVNDILGTEENKKYLVIDILGQGTFGQVVKCQNLKTNEIVAIKVVKARQECLQQSITEGNILEYLSKRVDPKYEKYFISLKDKFMHKYHLCLVFELLSSNLYELIKQNHHHGLNIKLVKNFAIQILESLCALKDIKLIHCDLKPENILLKSLDKPDLKIIDFGSACQERQTLYTYVQSRFYRSPEVILGVEYSTSVDMWSFGCIIAELFLGLPIFPGASEYEQLCRIVETFGMPPSWMMVEKKSNNYFVKERNLQTGKVSFRLKSLNEFNTEFNLNEAPPKQYFSDKKIDDIIMNYRISKRKNPTKEMIENEMHERSCLVHFLKGIMNLNPLERWTPHEAVHHPFVTNEPWTGTWFPPTAIGQPSHGSGLRSRSLV